MMAPAARAQPETEQGGRIGLVTCSKRSSGGVGSLMSALGGKWTLAHWVDRDGEAGTLMGLVQQLPAI
jgi:hypothetical protein